MKAKSAIHVVVDGQLYRLSPIDSKELLTQIKQAKKDRKPKVRKSNPHADGRTTMFAPMRRWTLKEIETLNAARQSGQDWRTISRRLHRSIVAIKQKWYNRPHSGGVSG